MSNSLWGLHSNEIGEIFIGSILILSISYSSGKIRFVWFYSNIVVEFFSNEVDVVELIVWLSSNTTTGSIIVPIIVSLFFYSLVDTGSWGSSIATTSVVVFSTISFPIVSFYTSSIVSETVIFETASTVVLLS